MDRLRHFFVAQAYYTRMSHLFYGLMFVVVIMQVLMMFLVVGGAVYFFTGDIGVATFLWVVGLFALYLIMGLLIGLHRTRHGGASIAKSARAVQLFVHSASSEPLFTERFIRVSTPKQLPAGYARYYEFAEQMAIASGVSLPKLYVLPFEMGVNGFVAGFDDDDVVMILTQGAVDKLTNAELYGLIGHEFGHILHGDAKLNLRIYVMLSMLGWVYDLVDAFEEFVLGKFDKNYHDHYISFGRSMAMDAPVLKSREQWVRHLKHERQAIEDSFAFSGQTYGFGGYRPLGEGTAPTPNAYLGAVMAQLAFIIPLLLLRLVGALGMLGAEWVKKHFNHSREYLADATSVQLTRSPDVVAALQGLATKYPTVLRGHDFSTTMTHFFFASPKDGGDRLDSHPNIYDRIEFAKGGDYDELGSQIIAMLDVAKLEDARSFVMNYDYVSDDLAISAVNVAAMADINPLLTKAHIDEQGHTRVSYDIAPDRVVDGRLIVNDEWRTPVVTHHPIYPRLAQTHELVPSDYDGTVDHMVYDMIQGIDLPWQMVKALDSFAGVLHFIEGLLLCRTYECLDPNNDVDFGMIYGQGKPNLPVIARHHLPHELLKTLAWHDRRLDGLMLALAYRRLEQTILRLNQDDAITARTYQEDLARLINASYEPKNECYVGVTFNPDWLQKVGQGKLEVLYQAAIIGAMWRILSPVATSLYVLYHQLSDQRNEMMHWLVGVDDKDEYILLVLMAYLASIQDNSLLLMRYDRLINSLRRWCTSLQIDMIDDEQLITLMYQIQVLDATDWLILFVAIAEQDEARLRLILDTMCTACVYDGKVTQAEYDLLMMLSMMWQVQMPVV